MEPEQVQEPEIELEPQYVACFLCGDSLEVRESKRKKPYFICDPCGLQAFIRKDRGIKKLEKLVTGFRAANPVIELIAELDALEIKLAEIRDDKPVFGENPNLELLERAVIREIGRVRREIKTGKSGK